jgi:hypothetical protein
MSEKGKEGDFVMYRGRDKIYGTLIASKYEFGTNHHLFKNAVKICDILENISFHKQIETMGCNFPEKVSASEIYFLAEELNNLKKSELIKKLGIQISEETIPVKIIKVPGYEIIRR